MICVASNPFISAYVQSDWFGKGIFWGLFALSAASWWVILHKSWALFHVRRLSSEFRALFSETAPLDLQSNKPLQGSLLGIPHPFFEIYKALKQATLRIISRNHLFTPSAETTLSEADLGLIESQVYASLATQAKKLERNLFLLSTIATLGPFLGLLGTVWGILVTFSQLHQKGFAAASNASMLSGLSLALATTVIGLVVAIPALVGYNYLKNAGREYLRDMENFAHLLLTSVELYYKRPEHAKTATPVS
ncbi:MAG: MotA/TolQ/ExbB proton channel family protein [Chlamydiia bacterium]|nr:MotA/TolQ/ExbB proton channel family protein [Chlamydiia bacterium]